MTTTKESGEGGLRGHPCLRGGQPPHPHQLNKKQMRALAAMCDTLVPSINLHTSEGVEVNVAASAAESKESLAKGSLDDVDAFYKLSASDVGLPAEVAGHMSKTLKPIILLVVGIVLRLMASPLGTVLLFGTVGLSWRYPFLQSFVDLPLESREKAFQIWVHSSLSIHHSLSKLFKAYVMFDFYGKVDEDGYNPSWRAIGYCGADPNASTAESSYERRPLEGKVLDEVNATEKVATFLKDGGFTLLDDVSHLHNNLQQAHRSKIEIQHQQSSERIGVKCDVVVVGSGSGGGVIAGALAKAGQKVLILEKGGYFAREDLSLLESPTLQAMYERGGIFQSDDSYVSLLAGATVGGGSAVNWGASFQTPEHVRQEWGKKLGLSFFATQKYQDALDEVCARASVRSICEHESFQNAVLTDGCKKLGYDIGQIPRNAETEHLCGWCHLGCKSGEKKATTETWLVDAVQNGALILSNCMVQEVLHKEEHLSQKGRRAVGVVAKCGETLTVYVEAAVTVVCGGSLNTPPLLLRSGLRNPNIGRHLHVHPVLIGWGYFPQGNGPAGTCYEGAIMTAVSKESANWNSSGYGSLLEVPIMHPASAAALIPWRTAADHKARMRKYSRTSFFLVLTRDKGAGRVGLSKDNDTLITYKVAPEDENMMFQALEKGLRAMVAAGAEEVGDMHIAGEAFSVKGRSSSKTMEEDLQMYVDGLKKRRLEGARTPITSAHQMGSCRMGVSSQDSVVDARGETWEVEDLFLGDASVFPTASGVNPMITVQAIAYCTAQNILLKLQDRRSKEL